jgi:hypothetical protein
VEQAIQYQQQDQALLVERKHYLTDMECEHIQQGNLQHKETRKTQGLSSAAKQQMAHQLKWL